MALVATLACLAGCGGFSRMATYGSQYSGNIHSLGPARFRLSIHPTENVIMAQRVIAQATDSDSGELLGHVVQSFIEPAGCRALSSTKIAPGTWETGFSCPENVDLRGIVRGQRNALRAGEPIRGMTE